MLQKIIVRSNITLANESSNGLAEIPASDYPIRCEICKCNFRANL